MAFLDSGRGREGKPDQTRRVVANRANTMTLRPLGSTWMERGGLSAAPLPPSRARSGADAPVVRGAAGGRKFTPRSYPCSTVTFRTATPEDAWYARRILRLWPYPDGGYEAHTTTEKLPTRRIPGEMSYRTWAANCPVADLLGDKALVLSEDLERNDRRATQRTRRYIRANNLACLLTFTAQGKFATRAEALAAVSSFMRSRRARRLIFGTASAPYLLVAEPHKSGGWHVHAAVPLRFIPFREVITLWSAHLERRGHGAGTHRFTVGDPDRGGTRTFTAKQSAAYCAKYLAKTYGLEGGRDSYDRRYTVAQGFAAPTTESVCRSLEAAYAALPHPPEGERWFDPDANGEPAHFWACG